MPELKDWITIIAIAFSPFFAVYVTQRLQDRKARRDAKVAVFMTLTANRHAPLHEDRIRALNLIDVVFSGDARVRELWHDYYDMLANLGLNNPLGWQQRTHKNLELISEMARVLGYRGKISQVDFDRTYIPQGLIDSGVQSQQISKETLNFLRGLSSTLSSPFQSQPDHSDPSPPAIGSTEASSANS